ncbi:MAG: 50S ribosomal protein L11 methyltransferase, partial [Chthonomonadaceae bacterium]|nr:50S ribosomal protein L11 methyltransferase [Chthonomonadaceae bacterium]
ISSALILLAPEASERVAPGGLWIVSGVIEANWPDVLNKAESVGFSLETEKRENEWVAAAFRH